MVMRFFPILIKQDNRFSKKEIGKWREEERREENGISGLKVLIDMNGERKVSRDDQRTSHNDGFKNEFIHLLKNIGQR